MRRTILLLPLLFAGRLWAADAQPASVPHLPAPLSYDSGAYLYDGSGNIKAIDTDRYVYDAAGRLTYGAASRHSGLGQTYTYDAFGNMTSIDGGSGPSTFGVDPSTNRISLHTNPSTGAGYNTYADYDAAGNITSISGSVASTYDAAGMMSQFRGGNYYLYTADDERIATRSSDGTLYSWTLRDPSEKVLREYSETVASSGGVFASTWIWKRDYVYRDGVLFAAVTPSGTSEVKQHYHVDHLGTPRLITDPAGVQKYAYDYYAFGKDAAFNTGDPEALHFTGHERDYNSGTAAPNTDYLDYMHARYYSSNLGRFLSVDPVINVKAALRNPQVWNRYAYVVNNPLKFVDPTGKVFVLSDDEKKRNEQLAFIKSSVSAEAASHLGSTQNKQGHWVLNITGASRGDFAKMGQAAHGLAHLIGTPGQFSLVLGKSPQAASGGGGKFIEDNRGGGTIYVDNTRKPTEYPGYTQSYQMVFTHEMGHGLQEIFPRSSFHLGIGNTPLAQGEAVGMSFENSVLQEQGLSRDYYLFPGDWTHPAHMNYSNVVP